jgi:multicomponent Na+:H+ antiporter subunit B
VKGHLILRISAKTMIPYILVYGLYIIFHGDLSPGGGFQGGVVIASAFVLYGLIWGGDEMRKILPRWVSDTLVAIGVLMYSGTGMYCLLAGYRFLDYSAISPRNEPGGDVWGMSIVEYGVGFTVSMVMVTIYNEISEGTAPEDGEKA